MRRELKDYPQISLKVEELNGQVDFVRIFGRKGAVHIEAGSGKGTFLLGEASALSEVNFLGIEWSRRYYRSAVDRMGRWGVKNVRIIRTDAASFLTQFVADGSVDCFHIYFPDPWPKKRHHKRRFFNRANFGQLLRCLKTGGQIRLVTDHKDYFEQIEQVICEQGGAVERIDFVRAFGAEEDEAVGTNYERKYIRDKRAIHTIALRKK